MANANWLRGTLYRVAALTRAEDYPLSTPAIFPPPLPSAADIALAQEAREYQDRANREGRDRKHAASCGCGHCSE